MQSPSVEASVLTLSSQLRKRGWRLSCAESCTGGLIAAACTSVAGSSDWFDGGYVSYSYAAKEAMLGVDAALLAQHGAVSEPVVRAMVQGALQASQADVAVAVSGIAGPGGGSPGKPVGLVWFAWGWRQGASVQVIAAHQQFDGDRTAVRMAATAHALSTLVSVTA